MSSVSAILIFHCMPHSCMRACVCSCAHVSMCSSSSVCRLVCNCMCVCKLALIRWQIAMVHLMLFVLLLLFLLQPYVGIDNWYIYFMIWPWMIQLMDCNTRKKIQLNFWLKWYSIKLDCLRNFWQNEKIVLKSSLFLLNTLEIGTMYEELSEWRGIWNTRIMKLNS